MRKSAGTIRVPTEDHFMINTERDYAEFTKQILCWKEFRGFDTDCDFPDFFFFRIRFDRNYLILILILHYELAKAGRELESK